MRRTLALSLVLAGATLSAQDLTGGIYTGLSLPVGDLKDKAGYGTNQFFGTHVGGHLDFLITPHHEVRAHITYVSMPGSDWGSYYGNAKTDFTSLQFGADWVYNFQNPNAGWYTVAGITVNSLKQEWDYTEGNGLVVSGSSSQSGRFGIRGGAGYTFNKWFSLEGTLNQVMVDKNGSDGFGYDAATWLQASAVFRFGK